MKSVLERLLVRVCECVHEWASEIEALDKYSGPEGQNVTLNNVSQLIKNINMSEELQHLTRFL